MDSLFGEENVLEVHNCDLVDDPRRTMSRIFDFLGVDTREHYLDVCAEVFKSVSRSRNMNSMDSRTDRDGGEYNEETHIFEQIQLH